MNNISPNDTVFLDTVFLASFSISDHSDYAEAQKLLALLLVNNCTLYTSVLCIHELFAVIQKIYNSKHGNYPMIRRANRYLKKISIKILFNERNSSYKELIENLKRSINILQASGYIKIASLEEKHIPITLKSIEDFDSKPGDSFHAAVMSLLGITKVVTANKRDFRNLNLNPIWFN